VRDFFFVSRFEFVCDEGRVGVVAADGDLAFSELIVADLDDKQACSAHQKESYSLFEFQHFQTSR
jgi:hypothetical protein